MREPESHVRWIAILTACCLAAMMLPGCAAEEAGPMTEPQKTDAPAAEVTSETALFAAGCFWGVENTFRQVPGVTATAVGYSGGHTENPTYREVCGKGTGHAEVVRVTFDPSKVSYEELLDVFWKCHDPTQVNRQGPDVGDQYRSAIFPLSPKQKQAAETSKAQLAKSGKHSEPIATEITPAGPFTLAEDYHQQYLEKNGRAACPSHLK
jgi:peptide-methionine (S)-S-oxide reductase